MLKPPDGTGCWKQVLPISNKCTQHGSGKEAVQWHLVHQQVQTLGQLNHLGDGKPARLPSTTLSPINLLPGQMRKGPTGEKINISVSSDPFSLIHRYLQFVKRGGRKDVGEKNKVIQYFPLSLRVVLSRKLPTQTDCRTRQLSLTSISTPLVNSG